MEIKIIHQFFKERPALSKRAMAKEMGITRQYLNYLLNGERPLTESVKEKMLPVMLRYGYLPADQKASLQHRKQNKPQETKAIERCRPKREGIGLEKAHETIAKLKEIPPNDGLMEEAYDTVMGWIELNR